ncbi:amidohydrolase [Desulfitobacterium sp. AusDCA]|uniref:amidohydrolase n=1 Tax=Desulfitobacterium sp. AusDCA TaxID=3240383 RepID=UPI003DA71572
MPNRILLKNGLIWDNVTGQCNLLDILIEGTKIGHISPQIQEDKDVITLDLKESVILPGLIDCHTHVGIIEEGSGKIGVDNNEISDPVTPNLRGIDGVNPLDIAFQDAVKSGITTVMTGPGSNNVVGGLSLAVKTHGTIIDQMAIKNPVGLKVAFGENPITTYGQDKKAPVTRMGTASLVRELFMKAQDYLDRKVNGKVEERVMKLEAVIPVLKGEIPLRAHAHRADDIVTAIRVAEEFGIKKLVIEHGTEADLVADYLSQKNVPVAFGPMLTPRIKMELRLRNYGSVIKLVEKGIKVALVTDHPYNSIDQLRTIAALAVAEGLKPIDAIRCITIHPAEILECDQQIGKIQEGYDADMTVFSGNPLDLNAKVMFTLINGQIAYRRKE